MRLLGIAAVVLLALYCVGRLLAARTRGDDDDEDTTVEAADWIGKTWLDEDTDRELPRYLRRELGESLADPDGLKANDLQYLGVQRDARGAAARLSGIFTSPGSPPRMPLDRKSGSLLAAS